MTVLVFSQEKDLLLYEFEAIKQQFKDKSVHIDKLKELVDEYFIKAKNSKKDIHVGRAYYLEVLGEKNMDKRLQLLDSVISFTKNVIGDLEFPMQAYMYKSKIYFYNKNYKKSLDELIFAEQAAIVNKDLVYQRTTKYNIGLLKRFLGSYEEAKNLFLECKAFEESRGEEMRMSVYINILIQLSSVYFELREISKSKILSLQGTKLAKEHGFENLYYSFVLNDGMILNVEELYSASVDSINKAYPHLQQMDKNIANFYLGKNYYELGEKKRGIEYFKKIDTAFTKTNDLFPSILTAYLYLINYSKDKNDKESQLYYTTQLLKADSIVDKNFRYVSSGITKKYDVPRLIAEREDIIEELKQENEDVIKEKKWILILSIITCFFTLIGFLYNYRLKRIYEKRYQAIIMSTNAPIIEEEIDIKDSKLKPISSLNIDEKIIDETLNALKDFENGEAFLTNQISLKDVARIVNTNSKYLSKIVNTYKRKNFTTYINDLRVDYLVNHIQGDKKYQKYTIRAIAEEIGFSNPESFSRAFQKRTGLKPSYFIKKVRESTRKKQ